MKLGPVRILLAVPCCVFRCARRTQSVVRERRYVLVVAHFALGVSFAGLTGCSADFEPGSSGVQGSAQTPIGAIQGTVHGGQAAVTGSQVYLFAAGTGGYGTASTSLIKSGKTGVSCNSSTGVTLNGNTFSALNGACYVTTDTNGNFSLGGDYSCTVGQQVYMVAVGGNPGESGSVNNTYIVQMAALGQCPAAGTMAGQVPSVVINEVTTVAFAYAMAGFGSNAFAVGTDANGAAAIADAMGNALNMVYVGSGQAETTTTAANSSGTVPWNMINALADILTTCVNTSGQLNNGTTNSGCWPLFNYTGATFTGSGTSTATTSDEAQAIFWIAHNPTTSNLTNIWNLMPGTKVFTTNQTNAPTDLTLSIVYKDAVSSKPGNIAFDSLGNAWISDQTNKRVVKVTPTGVVSTFGNLNNGASNGTIYSVAVDPGNVVWALDSTNSQIYRLNTAGAWQSTVTGNQLSTPEAITFASSGSALVLNSGNGYISEFSGSGVAQSAPTYNQTTNDQGWLGAPEAIAVDAAGNAFVPAYVGCACEGVLANGAASAYTYTDSSSVLGTLSTAIVVDAANNPWQAQGAEILEDPAYASGSYKYNAGVMVFGSPVGESYTFSGLQKTVTGGGLSLPVSLAFDGAGQLWAANSGASTVSGFSGATALASNGYQTGSTGVTYGAAPDLAGNLWTVNSDGSVTEMLGVAAPTALPVYPGHVGVRP